MHVEVIFFLSLGLFQSNQQIIEKKSTSFGLFQKKKMLGRHFVMFNIQ